MAGGVGSRFWPLSREERPKQFLDVLSTGKTLIRQTYERFSTIIPAENFVVLTNKRYKEIVKEELPEIEYSQILCEPIKRNTAPCIAFAAHHIHAINPNAVIVVTPSDHYITNQNEFETVINDCIEFSDFNNSLMTIGIEPTRPETGYGYIQVDRNSVQSIFQVKTFTEKPDLEMAKVFMNSGEFLWNSGIFIWKSTAILEAFEKYTPQLNDLFREGVHFYNTEKEQEFIDRIYPECENISIDYAIMEKAKNVFVHSSSFGWSDIGTWSSLFEHSRKDDNNNCAAGKNLFVYNCEDNIINIHGDKVAVVDSLKDYIVIDNDSSLLICPKSNEQLIKRYLSDVQNKESKYE